MQRPTAGVTTPNAGKLVSISEKSAMAFMANKEIEIGGGILGDSSGYITDNLGSDKITLMTVMTEFGFVYRSNLDDAPAKPTLIVVATDSVEQTYNTMHNELGRDWYVFRYGNRIQLGATNQEARRVALKPDNFVFSPCYGSTTAGRHAVIVSNTDLIKLQADLSNLSALDGLFERVIIDERRELKTHEKVGRDQVLRALNTRFVWILTDHRVVDKLQELRGYIALLEKPSGSGHEDDATQPNPYEVDHPFDDRCLTTAAFDSFILPHLTAVSTTSIPSDDSLLSALKCLRVIFDKCALVRSHETIYTDQDGRNVRAGANMLPMKVVQKLIPLTAEGQILYDAAREKVEKDLDGGASEKASAVGPLSDHIMFSTFRAVTVKAWEKQRDDSLSDLVRQMREANAGGILDKFPEEPYDDGHKIVRQFLLGAPKMNQALFDIGNIVVRTSRPASDKVIVLTQYPEVAIVFYKLLQHVGMDSAVLDSVPSPEDEMKLHQFINHPSGYHVLITTFDRNLIGLGVHKRCHNIICLDQPLNLAALENSIACIHHPQQKYEQRVIRYHTPGTYMDELEERMHLEARNVEMLINATICQLVGREDFARVCRIADNVLYKLLGRTVAVHEAMGNLQLNEGKQGV